MVLTAGEEPHIHWDEVLGFAEFRNLTQLFDQYLTLVIFFHKVDI